MAEKIEDSELDAATSALRKLLSEHPAPQDAALCAVLSELQQVVGRHHSKTRQRMLIEGLGEAVALANCRPSRLYALLAMLDCKPSPDAIVRALIRDPMSRSGTAFLLEVIADVLVLPDGRRTADSRPTASLSMSATFLAALRKSCGKDFPGIAARVWKASGTWRKAPRWCAAWARFARAVIADGAVFEDRRRTELADTYARCMMDAGADVADSLSDLLLFLRRELGEPSPELREEILRSPVAEAARAHLSVGYAPEQPADTSMGLVGIPDGVRAAIDTLTQAIVAYAASEDQARSSLRARSQQHAGEIAKLRRTRDESEEERSQLSIRVSALTDSLNEERARSRTLGNELSEACASLDRVREDYENQRVRSESALQDTRIQALDGLAEEIRDLCGATARMIEMVIHGSRRPRRMAAAWNRLDAALWGRLGGPGAPVSIASEGGEQDVC